MKLEQVIINEQFKTINRDFVNLQDLIDNDYSRNIMRVLRHVKEMESGGTLSHHGIKSADPIGHGAAGAVFDSDDGVSVVKISSDPHDYETAQSFYNQEIPHMAKIHGTNILEIPGEPCLYVVKMEKLNPIDDEGFLSSVLSPMASEFNDENQARQNKESQKISKKLSRKIRGFYKMHKEKLLPQQKKTLRNMIRFLRELHRSGHHWDDRQVSQFMSDKNGGLKLVDMGSVRRSL